MLQKLSLTTAEIRAGYRRPAEVPRLRYLAKAMDGRSTRITVAMIKRAMEYAKDDGIRLDPETGFVVAEDMNKKPTPKRRSSKSRKAIRKLPKPEVVEDAEAEAPADNDPTE